MYVFSYVESQEDMARKCATPNPGRASAEPQDLGRSTPSSQYSSGSMPRSRSLGLGVGNIPDVASLLTAQSPPRLVEVPFELFCLHRLGIYLSAG